MLKSMCGKGKSVEELEGYGHGKTDGARRDSMGNIDGKTIRSHMNHIATHRA